MRKKMVVVSFSPHVLALRPVVGLRCIACTFTYLHENGRTRCCWHAMTPQAQLYNTRHSVKKQPKLVFLLIIVRTVLLKQRIHSSRAAQRQLKAVASLKGGAFSPSRNNRSGARMKNEYFFFG